MTAVKYTIGGRPWVISGDTRRSVLEAIGTRVADDLTVAATLNPNGYELAYNQFVLATQGGRNQPPPDETPGAGSFRRILVDALVSAVEAEGKNVPSLRFTPLLTPANG